jgi:hypothetical protein
MSADQTQPLTGRVLTLSEQSAAIAQLQRELRQHDAELLRLNCELCEAYTNRMNTHLLLEEAIRAHREATRNLPWNP